MSSSGDIFLLDYKNKFKYIYTNNYYSYNEY